jgi:multidrug efflux pump
LIEKTTVTVTTQFSASGPVMEQQITRPLEDGLSALQGLESMVSNSQKDESTIYLTFKNRSVDNAAADVRDMIGRVRNNAQVNDFPENARVEVTKGNAQNPAVLQLAVTGESSSLSDLYYYAQNIIKSAVESVPGVATTEVSGGSTLGMKIVLDPVKMQSYLINAREVDRALTEQNFEQSAGRIRESTRTFILTAQAKLSTPEDFAKVIVSRRDGRFVRLSDIATSIKIEPQEQEDSVRFNGKPAISILVRAQSDANPLAMSEEIATRMKALEKRLPKGSAIDIAIDNTIFVKENIKSD